MLRKRNYLGFTILELIITLVIIALVFTFGYMAMSGYLPKQRLNTAAQQMNSLLKRLQSRALTKGSKYGVVFLSSGNHWACGFKDCNRDYKPSNCNAECKNCSDCAVSSCDPTSCSEMTNEKFVKLREEIEILDCDGAQSVRWAIDPEGMDTIVFDVKGFVYDKLGAQKNFEIFIKSAGVGVREIEVNSSGLVELLNLGNAGNITPGQAQAGACVK